jgi:hypothetical protein
VVKQVREKTSPIASLVFAIGALLLFVAFMLQFVSWVSLKIPSFIPFPITPITIPAEVMAWVPIIFAAGAALSIISIIINPSAGKFLVTIIFIIGYLALALGWI